MIDSDSQTETELPLDSSDFSYLRELNPNLSQEYQQLRHLDPNSPVDVKQESEVPFEYSRNAVVQMEPAAQRRYIELLFTPKFGRFGFKLHFVPEIKKPTKSCKYTYSNMVQKLFAKLHSEITITFQTSIELPKNAQIRASIVFKDESESVVSRCPFHLSKTDVNDEKNHSVLDGSSGHQKCPVSGHHVIRLNYQQYKDKQFSAKLMFRCASSCKGGIDGRPVALLFGLYVNDTHQGQAVLDIKISSSPGRDRKNAEEKYRGAKQMSTTMIHTGVTTCRKRKHEDATSGSIVQENGSSGMYYIHSKTTNHSDFENHRFLVKLVDVLNNSSESTKIMVRNRLVSIPSFTPAVAASPYNLRRTQSDPAN